MKIKEQEPFLPFVTVDDILNFDPKREETNTESKFLNAVMRAFDKVGAADCQKLTSYLAIEQHMLNHGVRIVCGFNLTALRSIFTIKTAAQMHAENPKCRLEDVAERLGFGDRSSVWAILNNKKYRELVGRLCPELIERRIQWNHTPEGRRRILSSIKS